MRKKIKILFLVAVLLINLCGCYDADEPNDIVYSVALGIDKSDVPGDYQITIQFARPTQISGGASEEGGKSGKETYSLVTVDAPTIYSAINLANHLVSKRFTLSHTKLIVFSEEIAREGVLSVADTIARSSDIRPNIYMAVARNGAKEYLSSISPVLEINPEKYYQLIFENEYTGYVPRNFSQDFYFHINSAEKSAVLPLAATEKGTQNKSSSEESSGGGGSDSGGSGGGDSSGGGSNGGTESSGGEETPKTSHPPVNKEGFEYNVQEYIAGELPVEKENAGEVMGLAVFQGDKMVAALSAIDSQLYCISTGQLRYSQTNFYNKNSPEHPTTLRLEQERKPIYHIDLSGDKPKISLDISLEGELLSVSPSHYLETELEQYEDELAAYTKQAVEKFLEKTSRELASDVVGFGSHAKMHFQTQQEFEEYNWMEKYKDAEFAVDVKFELRGTGLIIRGSAK